MGGDTAAGGGQGPSDGPSRPRRTGHLTSLDGGRTTAAGEVDTEPGAAGARVELRAVGAGPAAYNGVRPPGPRTVLVVDDEPPVLALVARILRGRGYRVLTAGSPSEANHHLDPRPDEHGAVPAIDLLLTDLSLNGGSGFVLAELADAIQPGIPVLYMSGSLDPELRAKGRPHAWLEKPFDAGGLLAAVERVLDG